MSKGLWAWWDILGAMEVKDNKKILRELFNKHIYPVARGWEFSGLVREGYWTYKLPKDDKKFEHIIKNEYMKQTCRFHNLYNNRIVDYGDFILISFYIGEY